MKVKLKKGITGYPEFQRNQLYMVIGIEADDLRIWNDKYPPYLYPDKIFDKTDSSLPENWVKEYGEDGELYAYPKELNNAGLFEDYFDRDRDAIASVYEYIFHTKNPFQTLKAYFPEIIQLMPDRFASCDFYDALKARYPQEYRDTADYYKYGEKWLHGLISRHLTYLKQLVIFYGDKKWARRNSCTPAINLTAAYTKG